MNKNNEMPLESNGSFIPRKNTSKGKKYTRYYIYLPTDLVNDSAFPFSLEKQNVKIKIDGNKLVVRKIETE